MQRTYHRHMHVLCLSLQSLWTLLCWRAWVVFLCLWPIWLIQFFLASFCWVSCDPMERTKWRSVIWALSLSAQYLVMSLCVCSHQLAGKAPLMTIVLSSCLWVPINTIRNHFIDHFFCTRSCTTHPPSRGHPGGVQHGFPSVAWTSNQTHHCLSSPTSLAPHYLRHIWKWNLP